MSNPSSTLVAGPSALHQGILTAAVDRILPSRAEAPGASAAQSAVYVLGQLTTRSSATTLKRVLKGLDFAETLSYQLHDRSFTDASLDQRDEVLHQISLMPHPTLQFFFHWLVSMTLEGTFCDPRHGGNRDGLGWRRWGLQADEPTPGQRTEEAACTTS